MHRFSYLSQCHAPQYVMPTNSAPFSHPIKSWITCAFQNRATRYNCFIFLSNLFVGHCLLKLNSLEKAQVGFLNLLKCISRNKIVQLCFEFKQIMFSSLQSAVMSSFTKFLLNMSNEVLHVCAHPLALRPKSPKAFFVLISKSVPPYCTHKASIAKQLHEFGTINIAI